MRLLLLSDIHSNLDALESCLDRAPEYDAVANLGDVVGYGACPNQSVDLVRAMDAINVRGNHDRCCSGVDDLRTFNPIAAEAALWTQEQLSDRALVWLRELPSGPIHSEEWPEVQFVHGSPADEDFYITSEMGARRALDGSKSHITFFGHTHIQGGWTRHGQAMESLIPALMPSATSARVTRLQLQPGVQYLINPGSVGQPRDRDRRAAFALYDSEAAEMIFYRVPYDIARAQERIYAAGLPRMLGLRLESGR